MKNFTLILLTLFFLLGCNQRYSPKPKGYLRINLDKKNFFKPPEKRSSMITNINNLFYRMEPNDKELRILGSLIGSLSKNKKKHNWQLPPKPCKPVFT